MQDSHCGFVIVNDRDEQTKKINKEYNIPEFYIKHSEIPFVSV